MSTEWPVEFATIASAGYYVALRVGFAFPMDERNQYPPKWVEQYTQEGLMLRDPVVRWVYENTGMIRWSHLSGDDPFGVFAKAREFGLNFGVAISCPSEDPKDERSYGSFARADREFSRGEMELLQKLLGQLHEQSAPPALLTGAELEALRLVKDGLRLKEIAYQIGVSEGAIKQRLAGAKKKLRAKTNSHAATLAMEYRLF